MNIVTVWHLAVKRFILTVMAVGIGIERENCPFSTNGGNSNISYIA